MIVHPTLAENGLIVVGEGSWVLSDIAQLHRLVKTRNTRGLSAPSQALNAAGNIGWCTYFAMNRLWYPFVTNIMVISLTIVILGFTLSNRKQFMKGLATIVVVGPLTAYALFRLPAAGGWLGMGYNWLAGTPQLARIVRRRKVSGISERGLDFALGAMLFTLSYAILIHSAPLVAGCAQGLVYNFIIRVYYYRYRRHPNG